MNDPLKVEAHLTREGGRWMIYLNVPAWVLADITNELDGYVLVDLPVQSLSVDEPNYLQLVQMPLAETLIICDNCGKMLKAPKVEKEVGVKNPIWTRLKAYLRG